MAESSIYKQFIDQFFPMLGLYVTEKVNGKSERERTYLHKQRLRNVYSPDQKWESSSANTSFVAADYVSFDSQLPLKKRGSMSTSNGKLPKMGIRRVMEESDINDLNIMINQLNAIESAQGVGSNDYKQKKRQIIKKLADDPTFCSIGVDERNEMTYLDGISNGIVLVEDENNNNGLGLRVNYGYKSSNILRTTVLDECNGDDIQRVVDKANEDGNSIAVAMVSKYRLDKIRRTRWAKELAADYTDKVYSDDTKLPVPSQKTFLEAFESEFGFGFIVINRSITVERNGKKKPIKPFNQDRILFLPNADYDGSLVHGTLAEATNPADNVIYTTLDEYKLISRLRITDPSFQEITKGQALVLPVIEDVDGIYVLDFSKAVELDDSDATDTGAVDAKITIEGKVYKKDAVINALKNLGVTANSNYKDATIIKKINELSDEESALFMDAIKDELYTAQSN